MKLKNVNAAQQVKKLQRNLKTLSLDLEAIIQEHDKYRLSGTNDEIMHWYQSLPIESLKESLERDRHIPQTKYSLHHMKHKFALRKLCLKKTEEFEKMKIELNLAKIDCALEVIRKCKNECYSRRDRG